MTCSKSAGGGRAPVRYSLISLPWSPAGAAATCAVRCTADALSNVSRAKGCAASLAAGRFGAAASGLGEAGGDSIIADDHGSAPGRHFHQLSECVGSKLLRI